jgi:spermidine/putrescine-binding protein
MHTRVSRWAAVGTALAVVLTLASCGGDDSGGGDGGGDAGDGSGEVSGTLRIFAYVDAFDPDVFDPFLDQYPDLDVQKAEIAGDTEAVAKLKGGFETDIVNTCAGPVDQEIEDGSLQPIDTSRIDDWDEIYPFFKQVKGVDVDGETFMLPLVGGAYGLIYRPSAFDTPPTSWMDLYTADVRVATPDDPLTNIIAAGLALGYLPPQDMTPEQLAEVKDLLVEQKSRVASYYTGAAVSTLWKNGEVDLVPQDVTLIGEVDGEDIAFAPMETPLAWTCGYALASSAENLDAAYAFLNYALSPTVQTVQAEKFSYLVSNQASAAELSPEVREVSGQDNVEGYRDSATFDSPADIDAWTSLWQEVKAS